MTIHPVHSDALLRTFPLQEVPADSGDAASGATAYDSVWNDTEEIPTQQAEGIERVMMADGKIYVVLAVVLIIWLGLLYYLYQNDRKLDRLERQLETGIPDDRE